MTTKEIVTTYYAAFNAKAYDDMLRLVAEDILHEPNQGRVRQGKSLFKAFLAQMEESYDEKLADICYYEATDDPKQAAVRFIVQGKYLQAQAGLPAAHGQIYNLPAAAFLRVNEAGQISHISTFYNLETWIQLVS